MHHLWLMVGWSVSVLGSPPIKNLLRPCNHSKWTKRGPHFTKAKRTFYISAFEESSVHFHSETFSANLKNTLVAIRTINGRTLGRPVDSWVVFGDGISAALLVAFCSCVSPIHWNHVLGREWRCSWSRADRRCSNHIWVINKFIA